MTFSARATRLLLLPVVSMALALGVGSSVAGADCSAVSGGTSSVVQPAFVWSDSLIGSGTGGTTLNVAGTDAAAAGTLLVVVGAAAGTPVGATDTAGDAFTCSTESTAVAVVCYTFTRGFSSGAVPGNVGCTFTSVVIGRECWVGAWTGLSGGGSAVSTDTAFGTAGANWSSPLVSLNHTVTLVVGVVVTQASFGTTAGSGLAPGGLADVAPFVGSARWLDVGWAVQSLSSPQYVYQFTGAQKGNFHMYGFDSTYGAPVESLSGSLSCQTVALQGFSVGDLLAFLAVVSLALGALLVRAFWPGS